MSNREEDAESHSSRGLLTRRKFLQGTATGFSLTWGGVHVLAERSDPLREDPSPQIRPAHFVYGTHFYHPQPDLAQTSFEP
jgi:hypothetical protein